MKKHSWYIIGGALVLVSILIYLFFFRSQTVTFGAIGTNSDLTIEDITFTSIGGTTLLANGNPDYKHVARIDLGGPILEIFFQNQIPAASQLDLNKQQTTDGYIYGVELVDNTGFEGGLQSLCATPSGFPANSAKGGTLTIDSYDLAENLLLDHIEGSITVNLKRCTSGSLGWMYKNIKLTGEFKN